MAHFDNLPRVGRSQGAVIFWGLISVFFAGAFCYYYWKNLENEASARLLRDEVLTLQGQSEDLNSEKARQAAALSETKKQLDAREEFLQEKETKLAAEETRLENLGQNPGQANPAPPNGVKKFDDVVRKLTKNNDDYDVYLRGGRQVLRVPSGVFFAVGDATLKPDGRAVLNQVAQSLTGQLDTFELRVEAFTDGDAEVQPDAAAAAKTDTPAKKPGQKSDKDKAAAADPATKSHYGSGWELTSARAMAISRYFRDQTDLPFQNVIVVARADFQPVVANTKDNHARNRRIEITVVPTPAPYHAADVAHAAAATGKSTTTASDPLAPPPDPPATGNKGN